MAESILYLMIFLGLVALIAMASGLIFLCYLAGSFVSNLSKTRRNEQLLVSGVVMALRGLEGIRREIRGPR